MYISIYIYLLENVMGKTINPIACRHARKTPTVPEIANRSLN